MKIIVLIILVTGLTLGPIAFGHDVSVSSPSADHEMVHGNAGDTDCDDEIHMDSEIMASCGTLGSHCTSGFSLPETAALVVSMKSAAKVFILSDIIRAGLGPEAETPPPRV